jgi:peptidoglycan/LPS O-acetylase OafA/YrhL
VLDPTVLEFGLGCAVGAAVARPTRIPASVALLAAGIPVLLGGWQLYGQPRPGMSSWFRLVYFGTGAALLVYGAAVLDCHDEGVAPHWLRGIGDASYSLYLWHTPVVIVLAAIGRRVAQGGAVIAVLECVAALVVARWSYRWIEKPMLGRITTLAVESMDQARAA